MTRLNELQKNIELKKTYLCLGLDTDIEKIPTHLNKNSDPVFEFNKSLIDRLHNKIVAVKINTAFYEANGIEGWSSLTKTVDYINHNYPDLFTNLQFFGFIQSIFLGLRFDLSSISVILFIPIVFYIIPFNYSNSLIYRRTISSIIYIQLCATTIFLTADFFYFSFVFFSFFISS